MAGAKASTLLLYQVYPGSGSVGRSCAVAVCMVLKRAKLDDVGVIDDSIA